MCIYICIILLLSATGLLMIQQNPVLTNAVQLIAMHVIIQRDLAVHHEGVEDTNAEAR